jgi:hypothetical protein
VYRTFLYHCGPIHDIQYIPNTTKIGFKENKKGEDEGNGVINKGYDEEAMGNTSGVTKFVTCSSDRTIRFWHFVDPNIV